MWKKFDNSFKTICTGLKHNYVIICLRQLLYISKVANTSLNDWVVVWGGGYVLIELLQTIYER